jgi:2-iminobutanoate/2-iminopropanoate deaminase
MLYMRETCIPYTKGYITMPKQVVHVTNGPQPGGAYSPILRVGDFIFVSGQAPIDPVTNEIVGTTIEEQTARTLENIKLLLTAAGAEMSDVVKATVHLSDMALFDRYNTVYATYFPDPKPVRTTVGSQLDGFMVEIDVIAYLGA